MTLINDIISALVIAGFVYYYRLRSPKPAPLGPLPPGPKGYPLIGNLLDFPAQYLWMYFDKLFKDHGPIVHLSLAGQDVILLGSYDAAREVLDRNAHLTAGRPSTKLAELTMKGRRTSMESDNAAWRAGRKMMSSLMAGVRAGSMTRNQEQEIKLTMREILGSPEQWLNHFDRFSSSVIFGALYGVHLPRVDHPIVTHIRRVIGYIIILFSPASSIVNMLPFLDNLPLPDSMKPWRKTAQAYSADEEALHHRMAADALERGEKGIDSWVWQMHHSTERKYLEATTVTIPYVAGDMFVAGAETSHTFMQNFLLAAMINPEFLTHARAEVDRVVGEERLPVLADRSELPIVDAISRELLRWRPPVPQGLTHVATQDFLATVDGKQYLIPKGCMLFGSSWTIDHDPKMYDDPERFDPMRQLDDSGKLRLDTTTAFGFGRRVCVGQPFAERTAFLFLSNMVWLFNISRDQNDNTPLYPVKESGDITAQAKPFKCVLTPRTAKHAQVAMRDTEDAVAELDAIKI